MFSLQNIVGEARPIIEQAANVYYKHTKQQLTGIVIHGSAITGDFIPGCSDIDIKLLMNGTSLDLGKYYDIHKELAKIEVAPFRYIQCDILGKSLPENYAGFVSGTYQVIYGENFIPDISSDQLREHSIQSIRSIDAFPKFAYESLLDHGGNRLSQNVRLMITKIWPTLKNCLIIEGNDPIRVWGLSKVDAIYGLRDTNLKSMFKRFHSSVSDYYPDEIEVGCALNILRLGMEILENTKIYCEAIGVSD